MVKDNKLNNDECGELLCLYIFTAISTVATVFLKCIQKILHGKSLACHSYLIFCCCVPIYESPTIRLLVRLDFCCKAFYEFMDLQSAL